MNIALDGPSGSGKSTIAKVLSKKLGVLYLDTGAMYRACALKAHRENVDCKDKNAVDNFIDSVNVSVEYKNGSQVTYLDGEDVSTQIRENVISMKASAISAHQSVRVKLVELQRQIAKSTDCILDGRDIGTNVLPNAEYKFYITASTKVRTDRRYKELISRGQQVDYDTLYKEIEERDYNDSHREFAPLRVADGAIVIDTSDMTESEVLNAVLSYIGR